MTNLLTQEHFNPAPSESLRESHPNPFVFNDLLIQTLSLSLYHLHSHAPSTTASSTPPPLTSFLCGVAHPSWSHPNKKSGEASKDINSH
jgi:hypothetical protein